MDHSVQRFADSLQRSNIRPTYSRIKVLEYLQTRKTHPTAEEIYLCLVKDIPSLSKTTVYNTLKLFVDRQLAKIVTIEENEMRYDVIMTKHGHFKCEVCGMIYDFPIHIESIAAEGLDSFKINDKEVVFRGICPQCLGNTQEGG